MSHRSHSIDMSRATLIHGILDGIVKKEIIPLLPWHTRPVLIALNKAWGAALNRIGVQGGNRLHPDGKYVARITRLKQPLKCRLTVEYRHTYGDPDDNLQRKTGYMVKLFDGQWRNVPLISGHGPYTYPSYNNGGILGVVDGTLYFVEHLARRRNLRSRIIALDVGSGLWQWREVFKRSKPGDFLYICRSLRVRGGFFVFCRCRRSGHSNFDIREIKKIMEITKIRQIRKIRKKREIPAWDQVTDTAKKLQRRLYSPLPRFVHVGNRLYCFGRVSYAYNARHFDLNTNEWGSSRLKYKFRGPLNGQNEVLLVAFNANHFHILRFDAPNERWIIAGRMPKPPTEVILDWTWCVEHDQQGDKQLWIYYRIRDYQIYKCQVAERLWDETLTVKQFECGRVNETQLDQPFQFLGPVNNGNAPTLFVRSFHGFHRSDSNNFQDIPGNSLSFKAGYQYDITYPL